MSFIREALLAGVLPLLIAAAVALALRRMRVRAPACWAAGVGVAYVVGQIGLASRRGFARGLQTLLAPREASDWLPHAVLLAMGVAILAAYAPRAWRLGIVALSAALAIGLPLRLLAGHLAQQWSALEKISHLALLAATLGLVWLLLAAARDDDFPRLRQVLLVVAALGAAAAITLAGSFTLGRLCGVVAAALAGAALVAPRGVAGAAGVVAVSLGGLIILGLFYAQLHPAAAALLVVSIVAAAGRLPEALATWPPWQRAVLRTGLCVVPLTVALATNLA
jgi:hypothetical protein